MVLTQWVKKAKDQCVRPALLVRVNVGDSTHGSRPAADVIIFVISAAV